MRAKSAASTRVAEAPAVEEFSLYDAEEAVLAKSTAMLAGLTEVAGGVRDLAEAYRRSYREQRRLVRMSDRMQLDLQKANQCLAQQRHDLQALNEALSGEIQNRSRLEGELRRLADTDDLTGAASRRRFLELAERDWLRHRQAGLPLCVLMLDLDHFKRVNDRHGHAAGDAALVAFVVTCRRELRGVDVIGRMGGEEFAVLLPETSAPAGHAVADRLLAAVASTAVTGAFAPFSMSVSIGLAANRAGETLENAFRRADGALYVAKNTGRNRVCNAADFAPENDPSP